MANSCVLHSFFSLYLTPPYPAIPCNDIIARYLLFQVPGCIKYKGAKIQLLDFPGIIEGAKDGKGRGRQVIASFPAPLHCFIFGMAAMPIPLWCRNELSKHSLT